MWAAFFASLGKFFSGIGQTFLANIMASIPQVEQAALNFLYGIVDTIVTDIENGTIPLPALAVSPEDSNAATMAMTLATNKRIAAFNATKTKLATMTIPEGVTISDSLIYCQIEISVRKSKQMGNGGVFPGGNSGPQSE